MEITAEHIALAKAIATLSFNDKIKLASLISALQDSADSSTPPASSQREGE